MTAFLAGLILGTVFTSLVWRCYVLELAKSWRRRCELRDADLARMRRVRCFQRMNRFSAETFDPSRN